MKIKFKIFTMALLLMLGVPAVHATPTENFVLQVLPAPGPVVIDGKYNDWDLSGGVFACNNVEKQRDTYGTWFFAMYDAKNLYMLAHFVEPKPLSNPGQSIADEGFQGDSLQVRILTGIRNSPSERTTHLTAWRGRDGNDVIDAAYGSQFDQGHDRDLKTKGAQQAFSIDADGKGYVQEIAIPWRLLTRDTQPLHAGDKFILTIEPNFTTPRSTRLSVKDIFNASLPSVDRAMTFANPGVWGEATLASTGHIAPRPERIAGGREFPVKLVNGVPVIDWAGLIQNQVLPGFKDVTFTLPEDGYVSLNIQNSQGHSVCQLLRGDFYQKGTHTIRWDGLTTPSAHVPGQPVPAGTYHWIGVYNTGIGLKLRGWADNSGSAPWDNGPTTGWGGDWEPAQDVVSVGDRVYIGWGSAEAGKPLVVTDLQGNVVWRNFRRGTSGAGNIAVDNGVVYVNDFGNDLYHLNAKDGSYLAFGPDPTSPDGDVDVNPYDLWTGGGDKPKDADGMEALNGKVYISFAAKNAIIVVDGKLGTLIKTITVPAPGRIRVYENSLYVVSQSNCVVKINPETGASKTLISGITNAGGVAIDPQGRVYVGVGDPDNQVRVYDATGKFLSTIGIKGGRPITGPWNPNGMRYLSGGGLTVDSEGKLWVTENDCWPKRVSVWDTHTGKFLKEFFGPPFYGATGGAIDPLDPDIMVGDGCEWRLDPATGLAKPTGTVTHDGMDNSRFGVGSNGKLYLAVGNADAYHDNPVEIFERVGEGDYRLCGKFTYENHHTQYWADANGDGKVQPDEVTSVSDDIKFNNWYMYFTQDMTIYSDYNQYKVTGFTKAGAPLYDLAHPIAMPNNKEMGGMSAGDGLGSADGRLVLYNGDYGADRSTFDCYDIAAGKLLWSYPDDYVGVDGSHHATPAETGLIRGAYDFAGTAKLPDPIGNIWVIPTDVSEWHILNQDGLYIARLFQPDPFSYVFPNPATPGADMSNAPPGVGGEDFGGAIAYSPDGKLYIQCGKVGFWNLEVTGLDTVKKLTGSNVEISDSDTKLAASFQQNEMQPTFSIHEASVNRLTPEFTGDIDKDFAGADIVSYQKGADAKSRSAATWDAKNMYLAWDVQDPTPWVNTATARENMYIGGDTVDFQIGTDVTGDKTRADYGAGDLRLSIGSFRGTDTAMIYRKISDTKHPMTFQSGVVHNYPMDYVNSISAKIKVTKRGDGYTVEAAVPLSELGITPQAGQSLSGDFGVTYGGPGEGTRLRCYWSNQQAGIVDDAVFELMATPKNWGTLTFK